MAKKLGDLTQALLETAEGVHRVGLISDDAYQEIAVRHFGPEALPATTPFSCT